MLKGFTLIELLVVVLIIGILAAVALPQYQAAVEKSRTAEALTMLKNAHDAYEAQAIENGGYFFDQQPKDILDWNNGTWSADGWHFCTKYFRYEMAFPDIYAYRSNTISANCSSLTDELYDIDLGFPEQGGEVICWTDTDLGYKVCKGLVSQGFELRDER